MEQLSWIELLTPRHTGLSWIELLTPRHRVLGLSVDRTPSQKHTFYILVGIVLSRSLSL